MIAKIPLERVFDNPFQTRQVYVEIEALAESIAKMKATRPETCGLMQVASGRLVKSNGKGWKILNPDEYGGVESALGDEPGAIVQIAFAHRRLRAFHRLAEADPDYGAFPVEILRLDDGQMADLAWEENAKRKDLTAIEEAEALEQAISLFGYTQAQIGERWGLSQSAVANKLRLLKLPKEAKAAIRAGQLSEKAARALLTAMGKSDGVYQMAAAEILPPSPVSDEAKATAERLVEEGQFGVYRVDEPLMCVACNQEMAAGDRVYRSATYSMDEVFLCVNCYRIGEGWESPSAGRAEQQVAIAINRSRVRLRDFPVDVQIAEGAAEVRSGKCADCKRLETDGDDYWCYETECARYKAAAWKNYRVAQLRERVARDYKIDPGEVQICDGYDGVRLEKSGIDKQMVAKGGPCEPGKCKRLLYHYQTWESGGDIKPYADLPFTYRCNHSGAHLAAKKRFLESKKTEEETSEEVRQAQALNSRKQLAQRAFDQAVDSITRALSNEEPGAWNGVAERWGLKPAHTAEGVWRQIAGNILDNKMWYSPSSSHSDGYWRGEDSLEKYKEKITETLDKWRIEQPAALEEIQGKLERILEFVHQGRSTETITAEQVEGNRVNVERLAEQVKGLAAGSSIERAEVMSLAALIREVGDNLWLAAGNCGLSLPQDWGISLEIILGELIQGDRDGN